jgi:hypothetical protein
VRRATRPIVDEIDGHTQALLAELVDAAQPVMVDVKTDLAIEGRALEPDGWTEVAAINTARIATGNATFETEAPMWED